MHRSILLLLVLIAGGCHDEQRIAINRTIEDRGHVLPVRLAYAEHLTIGPNTPSMTVTLDGEPVGVTPLQMQIDFGTLTGRRVLVMKHHVTRLVFQDVDVEQRQTGLHETFPEETRQVKGEVSLAVLGARLHDDAASLGWYSRLHLTPPATRTIRVTGPCGFESVTMLAPDHRDPVLLRALAKAGWYSRLTAATQANGERVITLQTRDQADEVELKQALALEESGGGGPDR